MRFTVDVMCGGCRKRVGSVSGDTADFPEDSKVAVLANKVLEGHRDSCSYYGASERSLRGNSGGVREGFRWVGGSAVDPFTEGPVDLLD